MAVEVAVPAVAQSKNPPLMEALQKAKESAFRGGLAGASAQVLNVFALMWLRTTMNYQYMHGTGTFSAIKTLYSQGGIPRFYRGLIPALMQSPLCRFGDTAANVGVLALLDSQESTKNLPIWVKTLAASSGASCFRFLLMPIDAWKTIKQVQGGEGFKDLVTKARHHGVSKLWHGSLAAMGATWVGHYPWFFTHNYLSATMPQFDIPYGKYARNALIGFCSSVVSDTCSNSIRVIKTTRQTSKTPVSYPEAFKNIIAKDGILGLLGRGLATRIATNGLQGMLFSVGWKAIQEFLSK